MLEDFELQDNQALANVTVTDDQGIDTEFEEIDPH